MRILYVHDLHFFTKTGEKKFYCKGGLIKDYFEKFFQAGVFEITIFSRAKCLGTDKCYKSYEVFGEKRFKFFDRNYTNYFKLLSVFRLIKLLRLIFASDFVVINTPSITGIFVGYLCLIFRQKYVCEVAGSYDAFMSKKMGKVISPLIRLSMKVLVAKAQGATYVTNMLYQEFCHSRSLVSSNVIILGYGQKKKLIKKNEYKIGFLGGLNKRKGLETLLDAAVLIKSEGRLNCKFLLVGPGKQSFWQDKIDSMGLSQNVEFLGCFNKHEVIDFLDILDLYIQPSLSEGLPRATIEAMARGNPVITSNLPGFKELVPDEHIFSVGSAKELKDKICFFLTSFDDYQAASIKMLKLSEQFGYAKLLSEKVAFYQMIFNHKKSG